MSRLTTAAVAAARLKVCHTCSAWQGQCTVGHSLHSLLACPQGKFGGYAPLGDMVATALKPASWLVKKAAGADCGGCARRQDILNHLIPR